MGAAFMWSREWQINRPKRGDCQDGETQTDAPYPEAVPELDGDAHLGLQAAEANRAKKKSKKYFYGGFENLIQSSPKYDCFLPLPSCILMPSAPAGATSNSIHACW